MVRGNERVGSQQAARNSTYFIKQVAHILREAFSNSIREEAMA